MPPDGGTFPADCPVPEKLCSRTTISTGQLILLDLAVQRGSAYAQQVGRNRAVSAGVFESVDNRASFQLEQRNDAREAMDFRSRPFAQLGCRFSDSDPGGRHEILRLFL